MKSSSSQGAVGRSHAVTSALAHKLLLKALFPASWSSWRQFPAFHGNHVLKAVEPLQAGVPNDWMGRTFYFPTQNCYATLNEASRVVLLYIWGPFVPALAYPQPEVTYLLVSLCHAHSMWWAFAGLQIMLLSLRAQQRNSDPMVVVFWNRYHAVEFPVWVWLVLTTKTPKEKWHHFFKIFSKACSNLN